MRMVPIGVCQGPIALRAILSHGHRHFAIGVTSLALVLNYASIEFNILIFND